MSFDQAAILILVVGLLIVFALDRFRVEVVALAGLSAGLALGLVKPGDAFSGFANPAFVTVVEVLLIAQVLSRTGMLNRIAARLLGGLSETSLFAALCLMAASISAFMNNIAALALMIPVVTSGARARGFDSRRMLMGVSFAALLGGLCTTIGTPANLLVSHQLAQHTGQGFGFFDFAWAGVPTALAGIAAILLWMRRPLAARLSDEFVCPEDEPAIVIAEATIAPGSIFADMPVSEFPARVHGMQRDGRNLFLPKDATRLAVGDVVLVQLEMDRLDAWLAAGELSLPVGPSGNRAAAVVMPESTLVGSRIGTVEGLASRGIRVVAIAARTARIEGSLSDVRLSIGDTVHLVGDGEAIREALAEAGLVQLLPPASDTATMAPSIPLAAFIGGVALAAFGVVPPLAFGLTVVVLAATGTLNLRRGFAELDWSILILLGAMIPLGGTVASTGAGSALAEQLMALFPTSEPLLLAGMVLALAVLITPFVNNASAALVLAPIAVSISERTGLPAQPFLVAVALGVSIDFLTPVGHHNNTVVMGLTGCRFSDFVRAGWPVTLAAAAAGVACIELFWM